MPIIRDTLDIDLGTGEDRRRLDAFRHTRAAVPLNEVKAWVASWGSANEMPRPTPRRLRAVIARSDSDEAIQLSSCVRKSWIASLRSQ
ncbi:hypothetical protein [Bradyrhizobium sp.]|uniref:hypothetical protein n=1 Tax=Bradyrhizobium sp. TaxID=376 RepID=UPI004037E67B